MYYESTSSPPVGSWDARLANSPSSTDSQWRLLTQSSQDLQSPPRYQSMRPLPILSPTVSSCPRIFTPYNQENFSPFLSNSNIQEEERHTRISTTPPSSLPSSPPVSPAVAKKVKGKSQSLAKRTTPPISPKSKMKKRLLLPRLSPKTGKNHLVVRPHFLEDWCCKSSVTWFYDGWRHFSHIGPYTDAL